MPMINGVPPDLAAVRRRNGTTLQQIAHATKINLNYLQAIEDANYKYLPGGIYNISYIRQYAQAIDYDEEDLLEYYYRAMGIEIEEITIEPSTGGKKAFALFRPALRLLLP